MIELLIAMTVMLVGILALFAMFESGLLQIRRASTVATATALAESEMEKLRAARYDVIGLPDSDTSTTSTAVDAVYRADSAYRSEAAPATTLSGPVTSTTATVVTVASPAGFPTLPPFRIKVGSEAMLVTKMNGTTWTVIRGIDGTTASTHAAGAQVLQKQRVDVPPCSSGLSPCTNLVPMRTDVPGADGRPYRVDAYVTWQLVSNQAGKTGRNAKLVTLVVRDPASPAKALARVASSFDEATGR